MPSCGFRIPPMFGLDGDVCGATATRRLTSRSDSWLQQFACDAHAAPVLEDLRFHYGVDDIVVATVRCPSADSDECSTIRERLVAGISDLIPDCPVHGPFKEDTINARS